MIAFSTEFPIKPISDHAAFLAQVISWLRGAEYSTVFDVPNAELSGDAAHLRAANGEELLFREIHHDGQLKAIGFRHDFPDDQGRLWRTECVLRKSAAIGEQDLVRLRTQCIALRPGVWLDVPRKPYLVKSILRDGWGGNDGELLVSDNPVWLPDDAAGLSVAQAITRGETFRYLPTVYISASAASGWLASREEIEKIAFFLGGVAHVVVEPSRAFSFRLRDLTQGQNAYGGTFGIALPERGLIRRFYLGLRLPDVKDMIDAVQEAAINIRSHMPADGWDWTELQEQALRRQRERDRNHLTAAEIENLYQEEIAALHERIKNLDRQLAERPPEETAEIYDTLLPASVAKQLGPEIYPGEISDRLRFAARECSARADQIGLDRRTKIVLNTVATRLQASPALSDLIEDLERATKDGKRVASELTAVLSRHGYKEKSDNRHIRLEAEHGFEGLDTLTLPKTPSDKRGLVNLRKQVERTLGLTKLSA